MSNDPVSSEKSIMQSIKWTHGFMVAWETADVELSDQNNWQMKSEVRLLLYSICEVAFLENNIEQDFWC